MKILCPNCHKDSLYSDFNTRGYGCIKCEFKISGVSILAAGSWAKAVEETLKNMRLREKADCGDGLYIALKGKKNPSVGGYYWKRYYFKPLHTEDEFE